MRSPHTAGGSVRFSTLKSRSSILPNSNRKHFDGFYNHSVSYMEEKGQEIQELEAAAPSKSEKTTEENHEEREEEATMSCK